jgi:hypothetical protein
MQINLLRQLGIAARFVSGYYYFDMDEPLRITCVGGRFIPGIGWLGLDPSHGILQVILIFQLLQALREYDASFGRYSR